MAKEQRKMNAEIEKNLKALDEVILYLMFKLP